jgi:AraC-like DNA-binding protein
MYVSKLIPLVLLSFFVNSYGSVTFQENFEEPQIGFDTALIGGRYIHTREVHGSKAIIINPETDDFYFHIPVNQSNRMSYDFCLIDNGKTKKQGAGFIVRFLYFSTSEASKNQNQLFIQCFLKLEPARKNLVFIMVDSEGDTLCSVPALLHAYNRFVMKYKRTGNSIHDALFYLNQNKIASYDKKKEVEEKTYLVSRIWPGPHKDFHASKREIAVDNIILSDADDSIVTPPPLFDADTVNGDSIKVHVKNQDNDSLCRIIISDKKAYAFPLLDRLLPIKECRPFITPFPFRNGRYFIKVCAVKDNNLVTDYSPNKIVEIKNGKDGLYPSIEHAEIIDQESNAETTDLTGGRWYILKAKFSQVKTGICRFWLHRQNLSKVSRYDDQEYFDSTSNYPVTFDFKDSPQCFISVRGQKWVGVRVDGKEYLYIDDHDNFFKVDTVNRTARVRFKILEDALPGWWRLAGYMQMEKGDSLSRSYLFTKHFRLLSGPEINQKRIQKKQRLRTLLYRSLAVILLTLSLILLVYLFRKKKLADAKPLTLLDREFYLKDPNYRHRHIIINAQKYIYGNFQKNISLADVCKHLERSQTWVGTIFKEATGFTVVQFINQIRIEKAMEYLKESKLAITDIAMTVGFSSIDYFERVFKNFTGIKPSEYRKNIGVQYKS